MIKRPCAKSTVVPKKFIWYFDIRHSFVIMVLSLVIFPSPFQMLAEFGGRHAGVVPEKMAEIKFAGEIELAGNVLDGKPLVGQQQPRLIQPGALDVLMNGALARRVKQRAQAGVADFGDGREFHRLPVARWIRGNGVEHAHTSEERR